MFYFLFASIYLFILLIGYSQLKWLVDIFRAKIVDISEHSVTIEVIAGHLVICFNLHASACCIHTHLVK